jgi:hypothetical protein
MHKYPPESVLTAGTYNVIEEISLPAAAELIDALSPDNVAIDLVAPECCGKATEIENWFGVKYYNKKSR